VIFFAFLDFLMANPSDFFMSMELPF